MGASDDGDTSTQLQGNEKNDSRVHFQKYSTGSLVLNELDLGKLSGCINGSDFTSGVHSVKLSDQTEELMTENLIEKLIVVSPDSEWIPFKG